MSLTWNSDDGGDHCSRALSSWSWGKRGKHRSQAIGTSKGSWTSKMLSPILIDGVLAGKDTLAGGQAGSPWQDLPEAFAERNTGSASGLMIGLHPVSHSGFFVGATV